MITLTESKLVDYGIGIKTSTYFKLIYIIYTGVSDYSIVHTAVFGVN